MTDAPLDIAVFPYEHVAALLDGSVPVEGADVAWHGAHVVTEIFEKMIRHRAFDVAELGWTYYLRTLDLDDPPFVALPIFPNRQFRHSAVYVNVASGITTPQDLVGRTVGEFATYGHDAGFWPKGILADEYGVTPDRMRWVVGGLGWPMPPVDFIPFLHPADVEVTRADGADLGALLDAGEIDALVSADVPSCVLDGSPRVGRLFPDHVAVERDYYRRTGIFPIMHTGVVRRELLAERPGVARAVYRAFGAAKDAAAQRYRTGRIFNQMAAMVPWLGALVEDNHRLFPDDWWPYGVAANRTAVDTLLRYHHEQGLSRHRLTCEDVFVTELLDT